MKGCCTRCYWLDDDRLEPSAAAGRLHSPCQPDDHMILKKSRRLDFDWVGQSPWLTLMTLIDFDWLWLTLIDFDWLWLTLIDWLWWLWPTLIDFDRLVKKYRCDLFPSPFHHRACFKFHIIYCSLRLVKFFWSSDYFVMVQTFKFVTINTYRVLFEYHWRPWCIENQYEPQAGVHRDLHS